MTSGPVQRSLKDTTAAHPEVEFALVLARTIEAIKSDPQQLRSAVYELARQKLQQLSADDPDERQRLSQALEVAIAGVEEHTKSAAPEIFPQIGRSTVMMSADRGGFKRHLARDLDVEADEWPASGKEHTLARSASAPRTRWPSSTALRFAAMMIFFFGISLVVWAHKRGLDIATVSQSVLSSWTAPPKIDTGAPTRAPSAAQIVPTEPAKPAWLPTSYGAYAEIKGKLYELQMLSGRAPDLRVAVSAAILKPSETILPDGHVRFIVFRRDMNGAGEPADVRVVARVKQVEKFDTAGKAVVSSSDESWVIRNVSLPYRPGPLKEDPQMYEISARDPDAPLAPGRYVLVIKNQAFDFAVEGLITDKRQCLERLTAANGVFYSECQNP